MSKFTLDEAIKHCLEVAEQNDTQADKWQEEGGEEWGRTTACRECAAEHRQLAEWLTELKDLREENKVLTRDCLRLIKSNDKLRKKLKQIAEYKRLLKMAVEDLNATVAEVYNGGVICKCCKWESQIGECCCPGDGGCDTDYRWRYADEAQKLLND